MLSKSVPLNLNASMSTPELPHGNETTMIQSPRHIFDENLFKYFPAVQKDLSDLKETEKENNDISVSIDVEAVTSKNFKIDIGNESVYCVKWSHDSQYLAVGCSDGSVKILSQDGNVAFRVNTTINMPVTAIKWRPSISGVGSSSTLLTANASGCLDIWHVQSQKSVYSIVEENNQIFCLDFSPKATKFASSGMDKKIRIYDDQTKKIECILEKGLLRNHMGHSNRIFALKWKPDDPNIIMSGGWDNHVLFWDIRSKNCFRSIFGPHIAGQTIDIQNDIIVTGSWCIKDPVQIWEFKSGKLMKTIPWSPSPMIYSCSFCPDLDGVVAAAGTGLNEMRLLNVKTFAKSTPIQLSNEKGIYCVDWQPNGATLAIGGNCNDISILDVKYIKKAINKE